VSFTTWDAAKWDTGEWQGAPPAPEGWGTDWRVWYQVGTGGIIELNGLIVEAVWSTDSHTLGDGTFRGDIQPGTATVRLWDPGHLLDQLDKHGCVFAYYAPTGAAWCWFYDSLTRGLYAPGDPTDADTVFTGVTWPTRLLNPQYANLFAAQTVAARLTSTVAWMNGTTTGGGGATWGLPTVSAAIAAQGQSVAAQVHDSNNAGPGVLPTVRDAAAPGVAWLAPVGAATGPGSLTLHYARWETTNARTLDRSQVIAGPPVTASAGWVTTAMAWDAVNGANGATTTMPMYDLTGSKTWGVQGPGALRMWGDVSSQSAGEGLGCAATAQQLFADRSDPSERILSSVNVTSGRRTSATGGPAAAAWDPYAHHFAPTDVLALVDNAGTTKHYRVTKSDHRLTATSWQTTHTLEKYTAPTALP
jgi:hypothetical protein